MVFSTPVTQLSIYSGIHVEATVTTTPTDTTITCDVALPSWMVEYPSKVVGAFVTVSGRYKSTGVGANAFGNCQLKVSDDNGSTFPITAINLNGKVVTRTAGEVNWFELAGTTDITGNVLNALAASFPLKFEIYQAVAAANNLYLEDILITLHLTLI